MTEFNILFVDDDRAILELVQEYLAEVGYTVDVVDNGLKALELVKDKNFDIVFTDFKMPDIDGLELLAAIKEYRPQTEVIIVTGHGSMDSAITAMKSGSYDYLQKPFKLDLLKIIIDRIIEEKKLKQANVVLKTRVKERHRYDTLVGISLKMQEIYEQIDRMQGDSPNFLIQGESGTGKELTAHVVHRHSDRSGNSLVPVICKSFAKGVAEDKFAETVMDLFKSAENGTVFFDEIAELVPAVQKSIAEVVRNRQPRVRVIAATNRIIKDELDHGRLSNEFVSCLNEIAIQMPPLKERKEDICLLINHFLDRFNAKSDRKVLNVSSEAMDYLLTYNWPGNVIQLENVIERAFALGVDLIINIDDLPAEIRTAGEIAKIN